MVNPLTGQVDASYSYGPFGENFTSSGPEASLSPFGFQMMMRDPSGKWYDHARWYDADQGRFISEDPTAENGGLNLEAADNNDPINNIDQAGTKFESLQSAWNTIGQIAMFVSGGPLQAQVIEAHSAGLQAAATSTGQAVKQAAISAMENPDDFQNGQLVGAGNGAAKLITSAPKMIGQAQAYGDTLVPQIVDSLNGAPDRNESAYAFYGQMDQQAQVLQLPDQLRQQAKDSVVNSLVNSGGDRKAIESGAMTGELQFNVALLLASLADPLLSLDDIGSAVDAAALLDESAMVSLNGGTDAASLTATENSVSIASGAEGQFGQMQVLRTIQPGEKIADIMEETKGITFTTRNEVALVKLASGERALVTGGSSGITWSEGEVTRLFGHTHPYGLPPTGPSSFDIQALQQLGQQNSYILEHGQLIKFGVKPGG